MKILKFGQYTLKDVQSIESILEIIIKANQKDPGSAIVVSAMNKVSARLHEISQLAMVGDNSYKPLLQQIEDEHFTIVKHFIDVKHQAKVIAGLKVMLNDLEEILYGVYLLWELSPRTLDHINTYGVKLMAYLIAECLKARAIETDAVDAQKIIVTDDNYGRAGIDFDTTYQNIKTHFLQSKNLQVVTGYIGSTPKGESSTLGRSGSVLTATLLGAALGAEAIEIYTDRDGITNTDPAVVKNAFSLSSITYAEVMEMSNFDNKFIYPPSLLPAYNKSIPIYIKNLFNPAFAGTALTSKTPKDAVSVKANSSIQNISLLNIQGTGMIGVTGVAARVFNTLAQQKINVVLITQASSEHSICLAVTPEDGTKAQIALQNEFLEEIREKKVDNIALNRDLSIIAVIGENMKHTPGIAGKIFSSLGNNNINVVAIAQGSSELNISVVVESTQLVKALNVLQDAFFK